MAIDDAAGRRLRKLRPEEALLEDLALYDNKSWNDLRDFTKAVKAIALPQDVPSTSDRRLIELENQVQRLMEAHLALTQPTQVNKITTQCEICSGPYDTYVYIEDPEQACVDYASSRTNENGGQGGKEVHHRPRTKAPKRVHFVNSIVILSTDSDTEEDDSSTNKRDLNLDGVIKGKEGVKEQDKKENEIETDMEVDGEIEEEESKFETDEEVEEIIEEEEDKQDGENFNSFPTMEELTHHEWILKNPRPPWVKARIRVGNLNNIKISCMIGRIRGLKIFIGSFAYECNFMILEDTTSIIDHHLEEMVFERHFIEETGIAYNENEGAVMFNQDDEKITFKMPHTVEIFKQTKLLGLGTDFIPLSAHEENFGHGRTHYYQSLLIRDEYKQDGGDRRGIKHLI
ncbi:hypothetical protein Tco_1103221 [Tanacetum coccineum]